MTEWWKEFFDADYLADYHSSDMKGAPREANFVRKTLRLRRGQRVLDECCGYGRHAILLAQSGLVVTGFDRNRFFLNKARRDAAKAGVKLTWVEGDVRTMSFEPVFDAAINMFTAIGYFESDEENYQVVARAVAALKPGGQYFLDTINRDMIVRHFERTSWKEIAGGVSMESRTADWPRSRLNVKKTMIFSSGRRRHISFSLRVYSMAEVIGMFERAGLEVTHTFGNFNGKEFTLDSPRIIVVGRKKKPSPPAPLPEGEGSKARTRAVTRNVARPPSAASARSADSRRRPHPQPLSQRERGAKLPFQRLALLADGSRPSQVQNQGCRLSYVPQQRYLLTQEQKQGCPHSHVLKQSCRLSHVKRQPVVTPSHNLPDFTAGGSPLPLGEGPGVRALERLERLA